MTQAHRRCLEQEIKTNKRALYELVLSTSRIIADLGAKTRELALQPGVGPPPSFLKDMDALLT